ncbi:hypothetical protein CYMTET_15347 [Cymbomonas tetramitiformis]|uniref:RING-type domain-containing protein n=1 Tax=Cymbomonas tetramitiformis TaxID=36881 RepID=A0AAE0GEE9_9CHLO|nr:hypothetical protein CYMTET_15347 [Cymbomonas tetramitiformis]
MLLDSPEQIMEMLTWTRKILGELFESSAFRPLMLFILNTTVRILSAPGGSLRLALDVGCLVWFLLAVDTLLHARWRKLYLLPLAGKEVVTVAEGVDGDPYAVLGVARDADSQEVNAAWRHLARRWHTDKRLREGQLKADAVAHARDRFEQAKAAHSVLADPQRRAGYDGAHRAAVREEQVVRAAGLAAEECSASYEEACKQGQKLRRDFRHFRAVDLLLWRLPGAVLHAANCQLNAMWAMREASGGRSIFCNWFLFSGERGVPVTLPERLWEVLPLRRHLRICPGHGRPWPAGASGNGLKAAASREVGNSEISTRASVPGGGAANLELDARQHSALAVYVGDLNPQSPALRPPDKPPRPRRLARVTKDGEGDQLHLAWNPTGTRAGGYKVAVDGFSMACARLPGGAPVPFWRGMETSAWWQVPEGGGGQGVVYSITVHAINRCGTSLPSEPYFHRVPPSDILPHVSAAVASAALAKNASGNSAARSAANRLRDEAYAAIHARSLPRIAESMGHLEEAMQEDAIRDEMRDLEKLRRLLVLSQRSTQMDMEEKADRMRQQRCMQQARASAGEQPPGSQQHAEAPKVGKGPRGGGEVGADPSGAGAASSRRRTPALAEIPAVVKPAVVQAAPRKLDPPRAAIGGRPGDTVGPPLEFVEAQKPVTEVEEALSLQEEKDLQEAMIRSLAEGVPPGADVVATGPPPPGVPDLPSTKPPPASIWLSAPTQQPKDSGRGHAWDASVAAVSSAPESTRVEQVGVIPPLVRIESSLVPGGLAAHVPYPALSGGYASPTFATPAGSPTYAGAGAAPLPSMHMWAAGVTSSGYAHIASDHKPPLPPGPPPHNPWGRTAPGESGGGLWDDWSQDPAIWSDDPASAMEAEAPGWITSDLEGLLTGDMPRSQHTLSADAAPFQPPLPPTPHPSTIPATSKSASSAPAGSWAAAVRQQPAPSERRPPVPPAAATPPVQSEPASIPGTNALSSSSQPRHCHVRTDSASSLPVEVASGVLSPVSMSPPSMSGLTTMMAPRHPADPPGAHRRLEDVARSDEGNAGVSVAGGSGRTESNANASCIVCMQRVRNAIVLPCGHVHLCMQCAQRVVDTSGQCPTCRTDISHVHVAYF